MRQGSNEELSKVLYPGTLVRVLVVNEYAEIRTGFSFRLGNFGRSFCRNDWRHCLEHGLTQEPS